MQLTTFRGRLVRGRRRLWSGEDGTALVMALGIMSVLTIATTSSVFMSVSGQQDATRTDAGQQADALAETGVNDALAVLDANYPATYPGNPCVLHDQVSISSSFPGAPASSTTCPASSPFSVAPNSAIPTQTATYWGALRKAVPGVGTAWIVRATGSVLNPTGPGTPMVTRTITVKVPITIPVSSPGGDGVLAWIYSGKNTIFTNSVTITAPIFVNGSVTFGQTATVNGPLYATGSVSFTNNGSITGTNCPPSPALPTGQDPGCLNVGGNLSFSNNNSKVGASSSPIGTGVHIVGSCAGSGNTSPGVCGSTPPTPAWKAENVFASSKDNTLSPLPFKLMTTSAYPGFCTDTTNYSCIDYATWYNAASPGPSNGCSSGTLPSTTFDNNTTFDNSIGTSFLLTPATAYSCTTPNGSISWNPSGGSNNQGLLTVNGTVFIDGSAYVTKNGSNATFSYAGIGSIYLGGSFSANNVQLCAVISGSNCNTASNSGWNPNQQSLAIVANGNGYGNGPVAANVTFGDSVDFKSATFQGIVAGTNNVNLDTTSQIQGPMMSVYGSVIASQTGGVTFPAIPFAPSAAPGQPPPKASLEQPVQYGG